ncbi:MAG: uracil phosphoribosyltransferase [Thermoanaerobaculia bacterium]|nr:uracil phosphoribosyltransferase [Thermoanaerobaculia bacterium]
MSQNQARTSAGSVHVVDHPLVQHKLTQMRMKERTTRGFRDLVREVSLLLAYEITRDMPVTYRRIETPLQEMDAPVIEGKKVVLVAVMRAGMGLLDGMLDIVPSARVGHIGLYRDHETLEAIEYFCKLPENLADREVLILDPMLATGHTAVAATDMVRKRSPRSIKFACILAAPEGLSEFHTHHPGVPVYTCAVDERLNDKGYILPGLGDAGDRIFGTK